MTLSSQSTKPDFAFPKKVEKAAETDLQKALKTDNGPLAANALVRLTLAKISENSDSTASALKQIAAAEARCSNPVAKSVLKTLEATIYTAIYQSARYKFNSRPTIGNAASDDFNLWSRAQFLSKVESLTNEALACREALLATPLTDYSAALTYEKTTPRFYPTMFDFAASKGIANLAAFDENESVLNPALLDNPLDESLYPSLSNSPLHSILGIYRSWTNAHLADDASLAEIRIEMSHYIYNHIFNDDNDSASGKLGKKFFSLYLDNTTSEYSGAYLVAASENMGSFTSEEKRRVYDALNAFAASYPGYFNINAIKNRINEISQKSVNLRFPEVCAPGAPFDIEVSGRNIDKATILFYDVTKSMRGNDTEDYIRYNPLWVPIDSVVVPFAGDIPFDGKTTIRHKFDKPGRYVVAARYPGGKISGNLRAARCTSLSGASFSSDGKKSVVAVDAASGKPQAGVEAWFRPWSRENNFTRLNGSTNAQGLLDVNIDKYGSILLRRGDDHFSPDFTFSNFSPSTEETRHIASINTSLALYRPGDDVDFSVVLFECRPDGSKSPAANTALKMVLFDANYQESATMELTTDEWGRAEGTFATPADGLTGRFNIEARKGSDHVGNHYITVSDYKLPTFTAEITSITPPAKLGEPAVIKGKATTFAGFPVAEASVAVIIKVRTGIWFWSRTSPVFSTLETTTEPDGTFTVEIPAETIQSSPAPRGTFLCDIAVTSADGETQTAATSFNLGKSLAISPSIPSAINTDKPFTAIVALFNALGETQPGTLRYTIKATDSAEFETRSGEIAAGSVAALLKDLPVGNYSLAFASADPELADPADNIAVTVYRTDSPVCPVDAPLWIPENSVTATPDGTARLILGSNVADANVLMSVTNRKGKLLEQRWIVPAKGTHPVDIAIPAGEPSINVQLNCVRDCKSYSASIRVNSASSKKSISLKIETFRDKVTPGDTEKLTLRVSPTEGADPRSAVILDMSNKAIDVLEANILSLRGFNFSNRQISWSGFHFEPSYFSESAQVKYLRTTDLSAPEFQTYGRSFNPNRIMIRGSRPTMMMKSAATDNGVLMEDAVETIEEMSAPMFAAAGAADSAVAEEAVAEEAAEEEAQQPSTGESGYRPSEIPLAFFRPMLTTDADGSLTVEYEVPDANTTWLLRSLAYNREMLSATAEADIVASKPIMVNGNAPRFLRIGDTAEIAATVMNNTDSVMTIDVALSLEASGSGETLATLALPVTLEPMTSKALSLPVTAPDNAPGVIFKVKGVSGNFTDGEQSLIAVLPAGQNVVESAMFYLAPGQSTFSMPVNAAASGSQVKLSFTENPAWEVVSALPGLREGQINSSNEAAAALLSAAVADGLMRDNPEIARALRRWAENPGDSALISKLEKDSQLKQMLLSSTPWVQAALSDTERMQRLTLLLNGKNTAKVIAKAIADLRKTAAPNGGWYWTANYPNVSEWATYNVMGMLGDLKRLGWLPASKDLDKMIEDACGYMDSEVVRDFNKYPKGDYSHYVVVRDMFKNVRRSTAAQRVTDSQVQKCIASWKDHGVAAKAVDALILHANGYNATAKQILASLREFSTSTPEKGMWWAQLNNTWMWSLDKVGITSIILDAFASVEPNCADIDKIRQWLILQKENCDWGSTVVTSQVVASILSSGSKWTVNPGATVIRVGDKIVAAATKEISAVSFTAPITNLLAKPTKLTIDRQANYPSFGAVVTLRNASMTELRAMACDQLSVEKSLSTFNGSEWIAADSFKVGDRVMVELTLVVSEDMDYVVITDKRAAGLEPASQLPEPIWAEGLCFYRENRDSQTNIFINHLPKGTYRLSYELFAAQSGSFACGAAQAQSQYNPRIAAHSAGARIIVTPQN